MKNCELLKNIKNRVVKKIWGPKEKIAWHLRGINSEGPRPINFRSTQTKNRPIVFLYPFHNLFILFSLSQMTSPFFLNYLIRCCLASLTINSSNLTSRSPINLSSYTIVKSCLLYFGSHWIRFITSSIGSNFFLGMSFFAAGSGRSYSEVSSCYFFLVEWCWTFDWKQVPNT